MICTSSHDEFSNTLYITYDISGNRGKDAGYQGKCFPKLAPKLTFWNNWHQNSGNIDEQANNMYYIQEYWKQVLSKLDPEEVYNELDHSTLLCYEKPTEFCHRHIVAAWFELLLDVKVPEIKIIDGHFEEISRPEYIKSQLKKIMQDDINMYGFQSLRAAYLFGKSERLEQEADELEKEGKCWCRYRHEASFLRCEADDAEAKYKMAHRPKKIIKAKKLNTDI